MMKIARDGRYRGFFLFKKFSYAPFQIQLRDYTNSDALISPVLAHVSLSKDDGDGNEKGKKAIGFARYFVHFVAVTARQQR